TRITESAKVARVVTSEIHFTALTALASSEARNARRNRMAATPINGVKVVRERIPVMGTPLPLGPLHQRVGQETRHAEQHYERIVIDVTGLQPSGAPAQHVGDRRNAVGAEPVDDLLVAALPEEIAQRLGAPHERRLIKLV